MTMIRIEYINGNISYKTLRGFEEDNNHSFGINDNVKDFYELSYDEYRHIDNCLNK